MIGNTHRELLDPTSLWTAVALKRKLAAFLCLSKVIPAYNSDVIKKSPRMAIGA